MTQDIRPGELAVMGQGGRWYEAEQPEEELVGMVTLAYYPNAGRLQWSEPRLTPQGKAIKVRCTLRGEDLRENPEAADLLRRAIDGLMVQQ